MFTVSGLLAELKYLENIGMGERFVKKIGEDGVIILEKENAASPVSD